ncbi:MAG: transposase [Calditrichia bacterium]
MPVGAGLASARHNANPGDNNYQLSSIGKIIKQQWQDIPNHYNDVQLDEYVIMPNHIHGIIVINQTRLRADARPAPTISQIICSFKSRSSVEYIRYIKRNNLNFSGKIWQRSFYDHVIRNERSLNAIRDYIADNPNNWEQDIEHLLDL